MWLFLALLGVGPVAADLPVHCLRHQMLGRWHFFLGPPQEERSACGHQRPDRPDQQPPRSVANASVWEVELLSPNVAHSNGSRGRWTMIYDEAMEVQVNGLSFLAFSRFELGEGGANVSLCGETQLGWYRDEPGSRWGCFYGLKTEDQPSPGAAGPARDSRRAGPGAPLDASEHWAFVGALNLLQDAWKATVYDRFVGKTLQELNALAGIFRPFTRQKSREADPDFGAVPSFLQRARQRSKAVKGRRPLPTQWDWRNVSGRNFLDEVIDQGTCGSCYMVATTHMLAARYRIKHDPHFEGFSFNFPLFCSEYNQGCDGGYAFLAARWASDVGLVPKNCSVEDPQGLLQRCELRCAPQQLSHSWRAVNHHYVGGYYGAASEEEMKQELVEDGPLVVSFEPQSDLMYYSGGIYSSVAHGQRAEWEPVDHAVLLVGYGSEDGRKYWLLQNSWGHDWGEDGFMRMARGIDESGIESIAEAADVEVTSSPRPNARSLLQFALSL